MTFLVENITKEKGNAVFLFSKNYVFLPVVFLVQIDFAEELPLAKTGHRLKPI